MKLLYLKLKFNTGHEIVFSGDNTMLKTSLKNLFKQDKRLIEAYDLASEFPRKPAALTLLN